MPVTIPVGPTFTAARRATIPVPQAIDYAFAQLRPSEVYQDGGPWPKHSRDQLPFVHFGRTTSDLPLTLLLHQMMPKGRSLLRL